MQSKDKKSHEANQEALREIGIVILDPTEKSVGEGGRAKSEKLPEDPFSGLSNQGKVIQPPFDLLVLAMLREHSCELGQCIEALEINMAATGHRFISRLRIDDVAGYTPAADTTEAPGQGEEEEEEGGESVKKAPEFSDTDILEADRKRILAAAHAEKVHLINFFEYSTEESFTAFRRRLRVDLESTGNAWFEVMRNGKGDIAGFTHLPSYQMRLGRMDSEPFLVDRPILELQLDGSVVAKTVKQYRRFRRHVQSRSIRLRTMDVVDGNKVRWYKDFGDPRNVNKNTGEYETEEKPIPECDRANEVVHLKIYSPRTPYGLPRYIGQLLTIYGDRSAEEINFQTFRNNNIPSMVLMVSNGYLPKTTLKRIESFLESNVQTSQNRSRILILQAVGNQAEDQEGQQPVKLEMKPLTREQISDAMFQDYSKNNRSSIRRAFRLPPIFVGVSEDYTRATAESSRRLADEQIFEPERAEFDRMMNRIIFPAMGIVYHRYKSNTPNTTDNTQLVRILAGAEKTGGMTPEIARVMIEDILGIDLPPFPKGFPSSTPFSLTMAEAVKNKADPTEPGQQVTAMKQQAEVFKQLESLGIIGENGEVDTEVDEEDLAGDSIMKTASKLLALQRATELLWRVQGLAK